ncbi:MAG: PAS domain S-box protein [Theionarchaea archaeon]|nr:MAG: hypothetical protein AYK19_09565 [Theionarchaea archaeon DG-70-1]MBU7028592.1 PAS domain S-box protein [Theionarchaea archaeon]
MNIYALSSLLASYVFFVVGIFIYQKDAKNELNRIYMLTCALLGYLAFLEYCLREAPDAEAAHFIFKVGSLWPFGIALYMHFVLIFTKKRVLQRKLTYFLLYVPALIFAVLELTTNTLTGEPVKEYWGWTYSVPENALIYNINALWFFFLTILPIILCFSYFYRAENTIEKRRAAFVFISALIPAVVGLATEGVSPATGARVPEMTLVASTFEVVIIAYGIHKYNIFALTPAVAADDIVSAMSNVLFLVRKDGCISLANQSALTLLGYNESELMGHPLKSIFAEHEWENIQKGFDLAHFPISRETTVKTKDGRMIPVFLSISVVRDEDGSSLGILCVGHDLTDHRKAEEARKKDVLLKEIHHRVKNNMQIISSLLSLQARYITDEKYKEMFEESQNRIRSMASIHEKLYQSGDLESINFREYIIEMVNRLVRSYGQDIVLRIDVDDIVLGVDTAVPCGLVFNELVTNALKHAFPRRKGEVKVGLHAGEGTIELVVADDGVGIPDDVDFRNTETLGLRLVTILAEDQLNGEIRLTRDKGTKFCITFKNE